MGHVIVTARSLGWLLLSVVALMAVLGALVSPRWVVASPGDSGADSLGLSMRCRLMSRQPGPQPTAAPAPAPVPRAHCGPLPAGVSPGAWTGALVLLGAGAALAALAALAGLLGCCVHAVCGKSILGVCGAAQAAAGVLYLLGLALFAAGWGADRVRRLCGPDAAPFYLDSCSLGWASYSAAAGALLTLVVAVLSAPADRAARSDKVQERIYQGHTLVCIA
ncbi:LHFPL tetraspan subfamily member 2a protein [Frankliniella fusca]|uniref:LHFPL tetraspan subfamily member 2a protein n=1 Tax=Frankliniella fusca TaxID=407009 RepID=A0AAE1HRT3_9NEOP|nr:LHFPL tetraspan subfamily member 2a protein [Frankliniella fusca]